MLDLPYEEYCFYSNEWSLASIINHDKRPTGDPYFTKLVHPTSIIFNITKKRLNRYEFDLDDPYKLFTEEVCPYLKTT